MADKINEELCSFQMIQHQINIKGLSDTEVSKSRDQYGNNSIEITENRVLLACVERSSF